MLIGVLSDTHDEFVRTEAAVELLLGEGADVLIHCGDLTSPEIVRICAQAPSYFVFGNHDSDMVRILENAATQHGAKCLGWGGSFTAAGKQIAVVHGHLTMDVRPLIATQPAYLLSGHTHETHDRRDGDTRRINPGALHRAETFTVATLDIESDIVKFLEVAR